MAEPPFRLAPEFAAKSVSGPRTNGFAVDIHNREAVRNYFNAVFYSGSGAQANWTGDIANCDPGTTAAAYQEAVLTRINFYRAMAGVPADVVFNPEFSANAAAAAVIVSANEMVTHNPSESMSCYSEQGREAAASSNLALGTAGIDSIEAYMLDAGNNYRVGHRRWLLYPQTREMGNADIDPPDGSATRRANANWIFDANFGTQRPATRDGFVAWPPAGFVPHKIVYPRWSFSYPRADFTNATVSVSRNGVALPVHIEKVESGYGEESIVFVPGEIAPDARRIHERPASDVHYEVTIANALLGGAPTNFTYTVTVFDADGTSSAAALVGSDNPQINRTNRYGLEAIESASGYEFRAGTLVPFHTIEGAEDGMASIGSVTSALYEVIQTNIVATGEAAFHLAHTTPPRAQSFTIGKWIVPSARSELRFQSRLGAASTGQVARVLVSVDSGSSWREIYAQAGDDGSGELNFSQRTASLAGFAGRAILLRFEYGFAFGGFTYMPGAGEQIGWYVDDVQVTFAQELLATESATASEPEFEFIPTVSGSYRLDARPILFGSFGGEWTGGTVVSAVSAPATPPSVSITSIQRNRSTWEITFDAENISGTNIFQIEQSAGLSSPWEIVSAGQPEFESSSGRYIYRLPIATQGAGFFRITTE